MEKTKQTGPLCGVLFGVCLLHQNPRLARIDRLPEFPGGPLGVVSRANGRNNGDSVSSRIDRLPRVFQADPANCHNPVA